MVTIGSSVTLLDTITPTSFPSDTGTAFVAGLADRGPADAPKLIQNLDQFTTIYGARQSYSLLYDWLETAFREGVNQAYIGRVVGPSATKGLRNLSDGAGTSLIVTAIGPGATSANYKVGVVAGVAGGTYQIQVSDAANVILEQSADLPDQASAIAWSAYSNYVRITLGATALNPAVAALAALSAGDDDKSNIVDAQWATALALFSADLGPGQVVEVGRTSSTAYSQLKAHAEANNRVFIPDPTNTPTQATLQSSSASVVSRFGAMFAPYVVIPGLTPTSGNRTVPPSALICGLVARNDPILGPDHPAAGNAGKAQFVIDISQPDWDATTRNALGISSGAVNVIRRYQGGIRVYGWRALVNANTDANWVDFGNARLNTAVSAQLKNVAENFEFSDIDGQDGETINAFHTALVDVMQGFYQSKQFFGATASLAYAVETGPSVNTLTTIQNNELHGDCRYIAAPMAEAVSIRVVKRLVTQAV